MQIGDWLEYYDNGSKKLEAHYVKGECLLKNHWNREGEQILKDGTGVFISEGKVKKLEQEFKDYKKHGIQKTYVNGILSLYQEMSNGKANGVTRSYYENGNIEKETIYNNGSISSSKDFPKFENPKVETTIVSSLSEAGYKSGNYIWPDNTPKPLNIEALKNNIKPEVSILEAYHDDYILIYSYVLNVNMHGIVTHVKLFVSGNMQMAESIEASLKQLKFEVALKDEKPVESIHVLECQFKLVD
jgi:antitoxin component YwqK of YwqJK toxin-antitoxin module